MNVLLSINPDHVRNIFSGIKKFEFRRKIFARQDVKTVLIYSTRPVGMLVGEFDIEEIVAGTPEQVWDVAHSEAGISRSFYDSYFGDRSVAFALRIGDVRIYSEPIDPSEAFENFTPPQSYMYVHRSGRQLSRSSQQPQRQMELAV